MRRVALAVVALTLVSRRPASADHSVLDLISTAPERAALPGGRDLPCVIPRRSRPTAGMRSSERSSRSVASDSNDTDDVYEWNDGVVRRIAQGLTTARISEDGSRIIFTTTGALVPEDTDGAFADAYELTGNTLRLISAPPAGSGAPTPASAIAITADNSKIFFATTEALEPTDTDSASDLYEREGGTIRQVSVGLEIGASSHGFEGPRMTATAPSSRPRRAWCPRTRTAPTTSTSGQQERRSSSRPAHRCRTTLSSTSPTAATCRRTVAMLASRPGSRSFPGTPTMEHASMRWRTPSLVLTSTCGRTGSPRYRLHSGTLQLRLLPVATPALIGDQRRRQPHHLQRPPRVTLRKTQSAMTSTSG